MTKKPRELDVQGQALEDAFFLKQDQLLIERLRALRKMEQSKAALAEISGIKSDAILTKFVELGIEPGTLVSIAVAPLVAVAWADGEVDAKERQAVLRGGSDTSVRGSMDAQLLEHWLSHKPGPELMTAWTHYVRGLVEVFTVEERQLLKKQLLKRAREVAAATGSFLNITSGISAAEEAVLKQIEDALTE